MQNQVSLNLAQIPNYFGMGRLRDKYLIFDNLDADDTGIPNYTETAFPIKSEAYLSVVLLQGSMRLMINLQEVEVKAGQVLLLMPGSIFQLRAQSPDMRLFCLIMDLEFTDEICKNLGIHIDLAHRYYNFSMRTVSQEAIENGISMYRLIKRELAQPDYLYKKEVVQRYCEIWMLKNLSHDSEEAALVPEVNKPLNRKEQIFHDFLTLLEKHYTQERSISFYADRMCLTPKYLSTTIKEVSGKHGMQWIDEYVALEAKALLKSSDLSVKQVSEQLSFPSQSMFGRFFKKMTGMSPKQYKFQ